MTTAPSTSENLSHDVIDRGPVTRQQLLVVGLCMFFNMLDGFDITAMAIVATSVSNELELTADRLGWIFSFALGGMMLGAMFLAPVSDIIGRRKLIIMAMVLIGVSIVLTASASTLPEFVILRFISGLGAGAMLASQAALASEYSPDKYKAFSVAAVTSGYPMGAMMTSVIAGFIMPEYGWRGMFWFGGLVTLSMVFVAWLMIPESLKYLFERRPDGVLDKINAILRKLKKEPLEEMPEVIESPATAAVGGGVFAGMRRLLAPEYRKTTLTLWTAFLLCFSTLYFLMSWIPRMMEQAGFSPEVGRYAFFLFNFGGVIGIYTTGTLAIRFHLTKILSIFLIAAAIGMIIFAAAPSQEGLLLTLTFIIGVLQQGGFTGLYAVATKVYPTHIRTTGIGFAIGLGRFGAVVGPGLAGFLIAAGLSMSGNYYVFAVPMVIGGLLSYRLNVK